MESQMVRRRSGVIAAHLASHEDMSASATHVFPCNSLNTVVGRRDNRTYFARQGSSAHGPHMRQASSEQGNYTQPRTPFKTTDHGNKRPNALGTPAFSRPAQLQPDIPSVKGIQSAEAPRFGRPNGKHGQPEFHSEEKKSNFASKGSEWSPRMDVLESGLNYVVTLEIPGVSIDNIKVEVDDQNVIVTGNRPNWSCAVATSKINALLPQKGNFAGTISNLCQLNTSMERYILFVYLSIALENAEPCIFQITEARSYGDMFSCKYIKTKYVFVSVKQITFGIQRDGLLQITIPKLSGLRWLRKAYM
ncbi:hypothetical protein Sango_1292200 [Sesamum angolense]|uniref:SHSP domain-containing protein n=1 Tax=Sesamum angolense TaxID=2727404 RepID=A0AAE1WR82_9LAMI|nr:hypothetical protein Sango_1292200 [Sesamum angolense]